MKAILIGTVSAASLLLPATALAGDGNSRISLGYTHYESNSGGELGLVTGRYQWGFGRFIGIEGEAHYGVVGEEIRVEDQRADIDAKFGYGGFVVAKLPLGDYGSEVFGRIGYQSLELEATSGPNSVTGDVEDFSFGGGATLMYNPHHGLRFDYTNIAGAGSGTDTYSVSYVLRF